MLKNKKAIVTGATRGIGKAIAAIFVKNGCDVAIFGTNKERAVHALKELNEIKVDPSQKIICKIADISDFTQTQSAIDEVIQEFTNIDILVNNAGITKDSLFLRMREEDFDRVIDVNLKSIYNTCKVLVRPMMKARSGKIINISSIVGLIGNVGQVNYAASKSAIIGLSKSLAKELATKNINVNCIAPGFIQTAMTEKLPEKIKEALLASIPMKKLGEPEDIAKVALFLATNLSDYITGQVITVDGGMVM